MGSYWFSKLCGLALAWACTFSLNAASTIESRVLYLARQSKVEEAIDLYRQHRETRGLPDYSLLQQLGIALLERGAFSPDPQHQLMAAFGAGVATDDRTLHLLEHVTKSPLPQMRLIGLQLLSERGSSRAQEILVKMLSSEDVLLRLEALFLLAKARHPATFGHAEALMVKLPELAKPLFAEIFAEIGSPPAVRQLRRLMNHGEAQTSTAAILSATSRQRDDLLPHIRKLSSHLDPMVQEACAAALGDFADHDALGRLETLARSKHSQVRLSASLALYQMGQHAWGQQIESMARQGDVMAVNALGEVEGREQALVDLLESDDGQRRLNATLALLQRRDRRCLPGLVSILIGGQRDIAFSKISSRGGTLVSWKAVPSASVRFEGDPIAWELSVVFREGVLQDALQLPEPDFLEIADLVLERSQNDLVPLTVALLENMASEASVALLKKHRHQVGAPLVRNYCNLALFKMGEQGPYAEQLYQWVREQSNVELIRLRPLLPWEFRNGRDRYTLTPHETSKLFLASIEALAARQDQSGIEMLLELIRDGHCANRYALAGLLVRTAQ